MRNRLRVLRAEEGWSQKEVAHRLGVTRQTVGSVEAGRSQASLLLAFKISHLFRKNVHEIFTPEPDELDRQVHRRTEQDLRR